MSNSFSGFGSNTKAIFSKWFAGFGRTRSTPESPVTRFSTSTLLTVFQALGFFNAVKTLGSLPTATIYCVFAMRVVKAKIKEYVGWAKQNPKKAIAIAVCLIIGIFFTAAMPAVLGEIGFSAAGPVAGSLAAAWQASIGGSVAPGSLFAILQSAAMAGYSVAIVLAAIWGVSLGSGTACLGGGAIWDKVKRRWKKEDDEDEDDKDASTET